MASGILFDMYACFAYSGSGLKNGPFLEVESKEDTYLICFALTPGLI